MILTIVFQYLLLLSSLRPGFVTSSDTVINGVKIGFTYSPSIFPSSWQATPINAKAEAILFSEIERSKTIMTRALYKYPSFLLKRALANVYFVRNMKFFDTPYGGTNSSNAVYISNDGIGQGFTNNFLEQTFHHEFSSILFRNHASLLDTVEWKKANMPDFDYNDPENGVGSIRKNRTSQHIDTLLCVQGFLTEYSLSSMENDINTFAQNLFCSSPDFWRVVNAYPGINKKVNLLVAFYSKLDPVFTESYFKKINPEN